MMTNTVEEVALSNGVSGYIERIKQTDEFPSLGFMNLYKEIIASIRR
jgi:hypothetical protein